MTRPSPIVLMMVPKVWLWMLRSGGPKFGSLKTLNASPRSITYCRPKVTKRLDSEKSAFQ